MQIRMFSLASVVSAIIAVCLLALPCARAEDVKVGDLVITQAWSRATPGGPGPAAVT